VTDDAEILVDGERLDRRTAAIAAEIGEARVRIVQLPVADYGEAMKTGFEVANGRVGRQRRHRLLLRRLLPAVLASDADLVIGSKRDPGSDDRRPLSVGLATAVFNLLLRSLFGSRVSDTHGMKGFRSR
jgi:hypothetical protein